MATMINRHEKSISRAKYIGKDSILSLRFADVVFRVLVMCFLCTQLVGCAPLYILNERDKRSVTAGEKAIVLIRVQCEIRNLVCQPFGTSAWIGEPYVALGLGSFESIGEPRVAPHFFLSEESRREGWTYFVLSPGTYYLAVAGPQSDAFFVNIREAPRWRIDVPENTSFLYAGTLSLHGTIVGSFLLGGKQIKPSNNEDIMVTDERELAAIELSTYPDKREVNTILMQRWRRGEPIIIRSPPKASGK